MTAYLPETNRRTKKKNTGIYALKVKSHTTGWPALRTWQSYWYNAGYHHITNIDFSKVVIERMRTKYSERMPQMKWLEADMTKLSNFFAPESFDVVIDKAGHGRLMCDEGDVWSPSKAVIQQAAAMCSGITSVLVPQGTFLQILFAQPLSPALSLGEGGEDDPTPSRNNQLSRVTSLIMGALKFIHALRRGTLEPDMWRGKIALCMHQYKRLFGCARVPSDDGVTAITERELLANLKVIHEDALKANDVEAASSAVGVLTTERHPKWAKLRAKLQAKNKDTLAVIDRALFLVCLDTTSPPDAASFAATALHGTYSITKDGVQTGNCMNRWYDKLQLIVCENGVAGCNFEHAFVDGHTVLRFVSDVFPDTIIRFAQTIRAGNYAFLEASYRAPQLRPADAPDRPRVQPHKLEWELDRELQDGIRFAEAQLTDLILQNEVKVLEFTAFGKLFITQHKMSPDAFVQMAFIAAYYFQYGRRLKRLGLLRKAISTHVSNVRDCAAGKGSERHLYALECLWQYEKAVDSSKITPALFADDAWRKLNHSVLSTSNCGNPSLRLFGFGPVVPDGFGIGYIIKDEGIQFCASSRHRQTERYLKNLESYLLRVQDLLMHEEEIRFPHSTAAKKGSSDGKIQRLWVL
ncbi:unnamed protein product [Peronospora belbahrii]|uniref:Choline/carnitine acyltransferase domain-containing protein n=1 Tax=Peronospora belbahrii TaxID=622444 RepID=A0ABN8CZK8_9STRA|nr:unnamed protein product [Peronospora belbahrii]